MEFIAKEGTDCVERGICISHPSEARTKGRPTPIETSEKRARADGNERISGQPRPTTAAQLTSTVERSLIETMLQFDDATVS